MLEGKEEFISELLAYDFPSISAQHLSLLAECGRKDSFDENKLQERSFAAAMLGKWLKLLMAYNYSDLDCSVDKKDLSEIFTNNGKIENPPQIDDKKLYIS